MFSFTFVLLALSVAVQGRAVNISNTWVLPEEGFPVFYRYFRDRISWYEADAVCQFHHANLVTVDTTAQYDAVRAYLKELDISSAVWVGLIRSNPDGDFTWTDYRGLGSDGYWSTAPDPRSAPLCAAADPAADYRWEARACGGPNVASFICELPVPQWALGSEGCMVRELPALTVLYLPESAAVQLTADCGLAGVRRVQCTGNVKREDLLRNLSCIDDDDTASNPNVTVEGVTSPLSTDITFTEQETSNEITTEDNTTTEHEDDINQPLVKVLPYPYSALSKPKEPLNINPIVSSPGVDSFNRVYLDKNLNIGIIQNNNLQSNDIPRVTGNDNFLIDELSEKMEDEKHKQHKLLHDEIARHGNLETVFTQPTDHFVPPLVMAKARLSNDMTVLSLEEKHAQQLASHNFVKSYDVKTETNGIFHELTTAITSSSTEQPSSTGLVNNDINAVTSPPVYKSANLKEEKMKLSLPKKYNEKYHDPKGKIGKGFEVKPTKYEKVSEITSTATETTVTKESTTIPTTTDTLFTASSISIRNSAIGKDDFEEESTVNLTVILKEDLNTEDHNIPSTNFNRSKIENHNAPSITSSTGGDVLTLNITEPTEISSTEYTLPIKTDMNTQEIEENHEVMEITIVNDEHGSSTTPPTIFEVTTRMPLLKITDKTSTGTTPQQSLTDQTTVHTVEMSSSPTQKTEEPMITKTSTASHPIEESVTLKVSTTREAHAATVSPILVEEANKTTTEPSLTTDSIPTTSTNSPILIDLEKIDIFNITELHREQNVNTTNVSQEIDDANSPLLSAANEPLHRPNRSRRPQPPHRINKFNPFRILG